MDPRVKPEDDEVGSALPGDRPRRSEHTHCRPLHPPTLDQGHNPADPSRSRGDQAGPMQGGDGYVSSVPFRVDKGSGRPHCPPGRGNEMTQAGTIRAGIGGWTFEPWEGTFYPGDLPKKRQLEYASRQLRTIEVNGTYYRGQTPATFAKWAAETPDGFVFAIKGNRFVTNRKVLAEAQESIAKFFAQGLEELGDKLGPIVWQFAPFKRFEPEDFEAFIGLLPREHAGLSLRHVLEVRHASFFDPGFVAMARRHAVAICYAHHHDYPEIADVTADFVYARLQKGEDEIETAYPPADLDAWAARLRAWAGGGQPRDLPLADPDAAPQNTPRDVFVYIIHEGKLRAPQGAMALQERVDG